MLLVWPHSTRDKHSKGLTGLLLTAMVVVFLYRPCPRHDMIWNHELALMNIPSLTARVGVDFDFAAAPHSMELNNPSCNQRHFGSFCILELPKEPGAKVYGVEA